jgi:creatinine amidohydrolase
MLVVSSVLTVLVIAAAILSNPPDASAQPASPTLPLKWEELTAPDFLKAVERSGGTCVVPLGVLEKHGPHLPLGTDLLDVREVALRAARKEYTIIFPEYYFSQIFEAKHQPGTIAYSARILWDLLQETCEEIARNGIKKIVLVSGHGGNNSFLPFFCQAQLARPRDYAVYLFRPPADPAFETELRKLRKTTMEQHAGEVETSMMLANRPELVRLDAAATQSGEDLKRLSALGGVYTGIWWYASFPNHYAGDGRYGNREIGEKVLNHEAEQLAKVIRDVKADTSVLELQRRFYGEAEQPLKTKQ